MKSTLLAALVASSVAGAALAQAPAQTTWNLATGYRAETFHTENLAEFARAVEASTQGRLRVQLHPDNALVKLADIPLATRQGKVEAGEVIMTGLASDIPIAGADSVPFVVASHADAMRMWKLQRPLVDRHLAERGLKLLYAVPWPPQGLFTTAPIRGTADFRGARMRTYNATTVRIAQLLHATPVDVPMAGVNRALAAGTIDSMITSAVTGVENRVWERVRYYYEINAWFPKNVVFVNAAAFAGVAPATQQAVLQAAEAAERRGWERSEAVMKHSTEQLRAQGMTVARMPVEVEQQLRRLGETFSREWVRTVGSEANQVFVPFYFR